MNRGDIVNKKEIKLICENEYHFLLFYGDKQFLDVWDSQLLKAKIRHYMFKYKGKLIHISFSDRNMIICSIMLSIERCNEKDIYKGYSWCECLKQLESVNKL